MTPDEEARTWNKPEPLWLERDWAAADEEFKKMPPHIQKIITESIRAEERERCAALIEGVGGPGDGVRVIPKKIADSEWAEIEYNVNRKASPTPKVPLWLIKVAVDYARYVTFERGRKILAAALRQPDTEYVCVRRELVAEVIETSSRS